MQPRCCTHGGLCSCEGHGSTARLDWQGPGPCRALPGRAARALPGLTQHVLRMHARRSSRPDRSPVQPLCSCCAAWRGHSAARMTTKARCRLAASQAWCTAPAGTWCLTLPSTGGGTHGSVLAAVQGCQAWAHLAAASCCQDPAACAACGRAPAGPWEGVLCRCCGPWLAGACHPAAPVRLLGAAPAGPMPAAAQRPCSMPESCQGTSK